MFKKMICPDCEKEMKVNANEYDYFYECDCGCLLESDGSRVGEDFKKKVPKNVLYVLDEVLNIGGESTYHCEIPKCPTCGAEPTYNMNPCPYCGQELIYPKEVK